jgi:hypothetical protein
VSLRRLLAALICGVVLLASLAVALTALVFAAHAAVAPFVGDAFAWAILLGVLALCVAVAGVVATSIIGPRRAPRAVAKPDEGEAAALRFARDQPVVAVAVAALGVLLAARNPRYLGAAVRAFLARPRTSAG